MQWFKKALRSRVTKEIARAILAIIERRVR